MKVLFDTSVLIATMIPKHPKHLVCFEWTRKAASSEITGIISTHILAELYGVLTAYPKWQISPEACLGSIDILKTYLQLISLNASDYDWTLKRMASLGLTHIPRPRKSF